jgi:hypothetical protein
MNEMDINLTLTNVVMVITELGVIAGVLIPVVVWIKKLANGNRCQLRNDMLQIYYRYEEAEQIPQYQYENFVAMYEAYKALKGNSFIDKIYKDIQEWEVVRKK